jgi:hypothetical protein
MISLSIHSAPNVKLRCTTFSPLNGRMTRLVAQAGAPFEFDFYGLGNAERIVMQLGYAEMEVSGLPGGDHFRSLGEHMDADDIDCAANRGRALLRMIEGAIPHAHTDRERDKLVEIAGSIRAELSLCK